MKGKETVMNIYTRLKQDHEKQRELCEKLKSTRSGSQNRAELWEKLKVELETLAHDVIHHVDEEEADIFPAAKELIDPSLAKSMVEDFDTRKPVEVENYS